MVAKVAVQNSQPGEFWGWEENVPWCFESAYDQTLTLRASGRGPVRFLLAWRTQVRPNWHKNNQNSDSSSNTSGKEGPLGESVFKKIMFMSK